MVDFIHLISRECSRFNRTISVRGKSDEEVATIIKELNYDKNKYTLVKQ